MVAQRGRKRKAAELSSTPASYAAREREAFTITWPVAEPASRKKKAHEDVFYDKDTPTDESMSMMFTVEPGTRWEGLKPYKKMKYQDIEFQIGDYIYVNRQTSPPEPPADSASDDEMLDFRKENMWVGRIQQVKALEAAEVFVRVFWLYWPNELPSGQRPYHGKQEMVMSNHADIIDATTISGQAHVSFWDENDDSDLDRSVLKEVYYRSTLNYARNGKPFMSAVRKHCVCRSEYNPDTTMYRCNNSTCGIWNHDSCLKKELLKDINKQRRTDNLKPYLDQRAEEWKNEQQERMQSPTGLLADGARRIVKTAANIMSQIEGIDAASVEERAEDFDAVAALTPSKAKQASKSVPATPSKVSSKKQTPAESLKKNVDGRIEVLIKQEADRKPVIAVVTLMASSKLTAPAGEWEIRLDCLDCRRPLD